MPEFKYKFLEEKPFISSELKDEPKFGHKEIISSLKDIVVNCISPFTIGLFGKWGSGKSTIAENLQKELKSENIPIVIFDVWKHEGDALRRTFIQELVRQLQDATTYGEKFFPEEFKLDERLDKTGRSVTKGNLEIDFKRFKPLLRKIGLILGITLLVLTLIGWLIYYQYSIFYDSYVQNIISALTYIISLVSGGALLAWFAKNMSTFVTSNDITYSIDRFKDPHEFEKEFIRVLQALKNKRILIVFDNLDRVSGKNSVRIISTIKTFLEPIDKDLKEKEVVFLIPCDVEAIKGHLLKVFKDEIGDDSESHSYSNEYLRKFFNTILWIPEFYSIELQRFAHEKLKETLIEDFDNDKLSWLITKVFKQNPRQIIQFINILISNYLLIKKRVEEDWLEEDFLKNNISQLAKFLLLNQKFPLILDNYRKTSTYDLRENPNKNTEQLIDFNEYSVFLEDTSDIFIESLEPFFTYRTSPQERKISGISKLLILMDSEKIEESIEYAKKLKLNEKRDDFSDIIMKQLGLISNPISTYRFLNILFHISKNLELVLHKNAFTEIQNRFQDRYLENIYQIDPNLIDTEIFQKFKNFSTEKRKKISKKWIEMLGDENKDSINIKISDEHSKKTVDQLIKNPQHIYKVDYEKLQEAITQKYVGDIGIARVIIPDKKKQTIFISSKYVEKFIDLILNEDFTNNLFLEKKELLAQIDPSLITKEVANVLLTKMTVLINSENNVAISDEDSIRIKTDLLAFVTEIFRQFQTKILYTENAELNQGFLNVVVQGFNSLRWKYCSLYVPLLFEFKKINFETFSSTANSHITSFIQNSPPESIIDSLNSMIDNQEFIESTENKPIFQNRALQDQSFFETFYESLSEESQTVWLQALLNGNEIDRFTSTLNTLKFNIPDKVGFANKIQSKTNEGISLIQKNLLFEALDGLNIKKSELDIDSLYTQVSSMLMQMDHNTQEVGLKVFQRTNYLTFSQKKRLALECLEWLQNSNQFFQPYTIKVIAEYFEKFDEKTKSEFVNLLFDKFIMDSNSPPFINQGFELLHNIQTTTLSRQEENFEKIKLKIQDSLNNPQLKDAYISGIRLLIEREKNYAKIKNLKNWLKDYE